MPVLLPRKFSMNQIAWSGSVRLLCLFRLPSKNISQAVLNIFIKAHPSLFLCCCFFLFVCFGFFGQQYFVPTKLCVHVFNCPEK